MKAIRKIVLIALSALGIAGLAACSTWSPYDYDDPYNKKREQADSCREDPYQDRCQPGAM